MVPVMVYLLLMLSSASAESTRNITLPGCPASCGNISIPYPFGIKPGCFRSSGFQLTCSTNRKLFLGDHNGSVEVTEIDIRGNQVSVNAPIFTMPADADSSITHWTPPRRGPYTVSNGNTFNVVGCGISAYMVDSETGEVTGMCLSVCGSSNHSSVFVGSGPSSSGNGYCSVSIINSAISYEIRLDRLRGEGEGDVRASGKAFLTSEGYSFMEQDLITPNLIGGSSVVPLTLDWVIRDRSSCMKLEKRNIYTYACRSNNSFCVDGNRGGYYTCQCSSWLQTTSTLLPLDGNPYVSGGCPDVVFNKELCSAPCGNISVPYPFGLGIECARDETFLLRCNASTRMLFLGNLKKQVTEIMVEEGQLLAEVLGESSTDESIEFDHLIGSRPTIVFDWVVDYMPCAEALKNNKSNFACINDHSECQDLKHFKDYWTGKYGPAYRCGCSPGYQGNPYTAPGCIDINECNYPQKYKCSGTCINYAGSFACVPSSGFDRTKGGALIGVTIAVGFPLLILSIRFLYR